LTAIAAGVVVVCMTTAIAGIGFLVCFFWAHVLTGSIDVCHL
jgi:hypothetical protein